jgi:hypothetical protein
MKLRKVVRTKYLIPAATAFAIVAGIGLFIVAAVVPEPQPKYPVHALDLEAYANYPGAQDTEREAASKEVLLNVKYRTSDLPETIEAFYAGLAANDNWEKTDEHSTLGSALKPRYIHGGYGKESVYGYEMSFGTWYAGGTHVLVIVRRSLPIPVGAQSIVTQELTRPDVSGRYAKFIIKDEPGSVLAFYRSVMLDDGWTLLPQKNENSIDFYLDNSSQEGPFGRYRLQVKATAADSATTQVDVGEGWGMVQGP